MKWMAIYFFYFIILLIIINCSSKQIIRELDGIFLEKINEIKTGEIEKLEAITKFAFSNKGIYIYDETCSQIFLFDKKGNFLLSFGEKGKGPGQFLRIVSLIPCNDLIKILDFDKRALIEYDKNGNFISEYKYPASILSYPIFYENNIISWFRIWGADNKMYFVKRGLGVFSDSLILKKEIICRKELYNPLEINPNKLASVFSINRNNGDIAYSEIDSKKFKIKIYNNTLKKELVLDLKPKYFSEEKYNKRKIYYKRQMRRINKNSNRKVKLIKIDKRKRLVKSLAYDEDSNLWVLSPLKKNNNIYIYDSKYNLTGYFKVKNEFGKIFIIKKILFNIYDTDDYNTIIEIYKIIKP